MKPESLLCMAGYMVAAVVILMSAGQLEATYEPMFACAGAISVGYWCAHLDELEA